jgi:uncharacterized membrane protein
MNNGLKSWDCKTEECGESKGWQRSWVFPAAIILVGLLLRLLHYLNNRSLWLDEAMLARNILDRGPLELLTQLDYDQGAPVLFLLLVDISTVLFGSNEMALRLVPLLAGLISLPIFYLTAKFLLARRFVMVAVSIFAFSSILVYYAQELKQYSMDVAIAVTLTYLSMRIVKSNEPHRTGMFLLGVVGSVSTFLSHPAIFVLAGIATTLIILKARGQLKVAFVDLCVVVILWGVSFGCNYLFFLQSSSINEMLSRFWSPGFLPFPTSTEAVRMWFSAGMKFLSYVGYVSVWQVLVLALMAVAVGTAIINRSATTIMIVLYFIFALFASVVGQYPFMDRLTLYLVPFVILLSVKGLQELSRRNTRIVYVITTLCLLAPSVNSLWHLASRPILRNEVRPLLKYLSSQRRISDHVYVSYGAQHVVKYYRRDEASEDEFFHYGSESEDDTEGFMDDINTLKKLERVWFLFVQPYGEQEALFLSSMEGILLNKRSSHNARLYLYRFEHAGTKEGLEKGSG